MKITANFKCLSIITTWTWLLLFSLAPVILVFISSFFQVNEKEIINYKLSLSSYYTLLDPIYLKILFRSVKLALLCTMVSLPFAYLFALLLTYTRKNIRSILLLLVIAPFWISSLIRTYSTLAIMKAHGPINQLLLWSGIIQEPLQIVYSNLAVFIGMVYNFLPFMILPIYANLEKLDQNLLNAAYDLGASKFQAFRKITLPFSLPGIFAGSVLVFLPSMTLFYIPDLLGSSKSILFGNLIQNKFLISRNWPLGAALTSLLITILVLSSLLYWVYFRKLQNKENSL